jgi:hypothetical protein
MLLSNWNQTALVGTNIFIIINHHCSLFCLNLIPRASWAYIYIVFVVLLALKEEKIVVPSYYLHVFWTLLSFHVNYFHFVLLFLFFLRHESPLVYMALLFCIWTMH